MSALDDSAAASAALAAALTGPAEVSGDAGSVRQYPIADLILADQYLAAKAAANTRHRGLRFNRLIPDGAARARPYRWGFGGGGWGFSGRDL